MGVKTSVLQEGRVSHTSFPISIWRLLQLISVSIVITCIVGLFVRPDLTLFFIWDMLIPVVPLLLFVAPGLWRNLCPLATLNQLPRMMGLGGSQRVSPWFFAHCGIISIVLLLTIVSCRKILFNDNAVALACLLIFMALMAIFMGVRYKGKSGWCTSFCPILPVERLYGQGAFFEITHSHCQPCVGCTKHCGDLKSKLRTSPPVRDRVPMTYLMFFASIFPGFIFAYYLVPDPVMLNWLEIGRMYGYFLVYCLISASIFFLVKVLFRVSSIKMTILYGAAAFNIYYWFNASLLGSHFPLAFQKEVDIAIRVLIGGLSLLWLVHAYRKTSH